MHGIRFSLKHPEILEAELKAVKNCLKKYPNVIFGIMIPQVISVNEIIETKRIADEMDLTGVKFGIMVETPAACLIIKDLIRAGIDFASLGTNDLTQYTLAIDRGNEQVQYLYNETHPSVINAIKRVIRTCNEEGIESSICGQAGSNIEMVKHLIEFGISSISVNADAAHDVSVLVSQLENEKVIVDEQIRKQKEKKENSAAPVQNNKENIQKEEATTLKEEIPKEPIMEKRETEKAEEEVKEEEKEEKIEEKVKEEEEQRGYENHVPSYTAENSEIPEKIPDTIEDLEEIEDSSSELEEITDENIDEILNIF